MLKNSDGNVFRAFSEMSARQPIDDRRLWLILESRVNNLSFLPGIGAEFFNTIGPGTDFGYLFLIVMFGRIQRFPYAADSPDVK